MKKRFADEQIIRILREAESRDELLNAFAFARAQCVAQASPNETPASAPSSSAASCWRPPRACGPRA